MKARRDKSRYFLLLLMSCAAAFASTLPAVGAVGPPTAATASSLRAPTASPLAPTASPRASTASPLPPTAPVLATPHGAPGADAVGRQSTPPPPESQAASAGALRQTTGKKGQPPTDGKTLPGGTPPVDGQPGSDQILTRDGTPCVPGAGVPLEEGIRACREVDLTLYEGVEGGSGGLRSWDRVYNVYACHQDYGWVNNSFGTATAPGYTDAFNECGGVPGGLRAKPAYIPGVWSPQWVGAEWILTAPGDAAVVGFNISYNCHVGMFGTGWGATTMVGTYTWGAAYPGWQGYYCYDTAQGGTTGRTWFVDGYSNWLGGEYPGFKISFHCAYAGSCSNQTAATQEMGTRAKNIVVHMRDDTQPVFESGWWGTGWLGALADGQWHSAGTYTTGAVAHDGGGGVSNVHFQVDGQTIWDQNQPCDYTTTAPCYEQSVYYWGDISTSGIADGAHTGRFVVRDLVGNEVYDDKTIYIDNTPPGAPQELTVSPGGWTAQDDFTVSWNNPGQGGAAPIDGFRYKVGSPPTSPTDGQPNKLADGATSATLPNVRAGQIGTTPVHVWLYDRAGNMSHLSRATGSLKFDDVAPRTAEPAHTNGWIGKDEADGYPQRWDEPQLPLPQSGIRGYATSLNRDASGDPGVAVTDPESPREKLLDIDEEGSWWFHVRPISGSGVPGPVDSTELKVDLTDPASSLANVPDRTWVNRDVALGLSGHDALSGVDPAQAGSGTFSRIDEGQWHEGSTIGLSAEGIHAVAYHATDVAGNSEPDRTVKVRIDKTAPTVAFASSEDPARPAAIHASAADALSGLADARIDYRLRDSGDEWKGLRTSLVGSSLEAIFPDDDLSRGTYELRIVAYDNAGNEAASGSRQNGELMLIDAPLRKAAKIDAGLEGAQAGKRVRCARKRRARRGGEKRKRSAKTRRCTSLFEPPRTGLAATRRVPYGRGATLRGVVSDSGDRPIRNATVEVVQRQAVPGAEWARTGELRADEDGAFALDLLPGYSREIRLRYPGTETRRAATSKDLSLEVTAGVGLKIRPKRLRNGRLMRFAGRVRLHEGAHLPPGGKLVALEFLDQRGGRKTWKVAGKVLRTNTRGTVKGRYRFRHVTYAQRIVFSLNVLREETFPYVRGRSKATTVTVRP